jgi:type III pantothenate kinase
MPTMNLIIDAGNTSTKIAFFENYQRIALYTHVSLEDITYHIRQHAPTHGIICSVNQDGSSLKQLVQPYLHTILVLDHLLPIPITNYYLTPQTLGKDRLAAVCGAFHLFPESACLVIDMGTCITYDFIDAQKNYLGGSISPGLHMRFKALHTFTARLPLLEPDPDEIVLTGTSTKQAIQSGVVIGMTCEIEGIIQEYRKKFGEMHVIFCGGDASFFENKIKESIFVIPELVLIGLNRILEYNVSHQ